MPERVLWLVRHGALPPNPQRRFVGAQDIPLSARGERQLTQLGQEAGTTFCPEPVQAIICSDLQRSRQSAAILAEALTRLAGREIPIHADPALREISLGDWQGLTPEEVEQAFPGQYALRGTDLAGFVPRGGESFRGVQQRALAALDHWRAVYPVDGLILLGHAGLNRCLLAHYLALPLAELFRIPQEYACVSRLEGW